MSVSIVRVTGDIIKEKSHRENLFHFFGNKSIRRILVISSVNEISEIVNQWLGQVFYSGYDSDDLSGHLTTIWKSHSGGVPSPKFESETNKLIGLLKGIFLTGDYSPALKDAVISQGEILTSLILEGQLLNHGVKATFLHPDKIGLTASVDFGNATFLSVDLHKIDCLETDTVYIVPGSFGITEGGKIARAGKSAADYTAAFLAGETQSERLVLWGTGKDFYAADHNIVPEAGIIKRLTYAEASELAYFDHYSLHPRTVEPLVRRHIPIHVIHADGNNYEPVTIINTENFVAPRVVKSVACTDDISVLRLNGPGVGLKPGILGKITGALADESVNIKSVITSQVSINILLDSKSGQQAKRVAAKLGFTAVNEIELLEDVSLIAIVGHGMQSSYGISAKLFGAVAQNQINVILSGSGASDLVSYLLVRSSDRDKSVKSIYNAFFKS